MKKLLLAPLVGLTLSFGMQVDKVIVGDEKLDNIELKNGALHLDVGIGSGAYHFYKDSHNIFYTITDRGPNIKCKDSNKLMGEKVCKKGKIFPTPNFTPTIYKIQVFNNFYKILDKTLIKDKDGIPVSGISNENTENAYDINGNAIAFDPNGLDAEALVKLSDGSFWIAEEYAPSILHIAKDGRILKRVVPNGFAKHLKGANYDISEAIPSIVSKRKLNRGIESIAVSKDEKTLYFALQSPLSNPDAKAYKTSKLVRVFKYDIATDKVTGEYVYEMDLPNTFELDKNKKQNDVKISEMVCIGDDELIVLERISKTTKFYKINLKDATSILGTKMDEETTTPSLEQKTACKKALKKELVLDTSKIKGMPSKIEGLAYIDENNWILVNDNDFGIAGDKTYIIKIKFK